MNIFLLRIFTCFSLTVIPFCFSTSNCLAQAQTPRVRPGGFDRLNEFQRQPLPTPIKPIYIEEVLGPLQLENLNKALISLGHKDLIPIKGIIKWSRDDNLPFYQYVTCALSRGGLVRVEIEAIPNKPDSLKVRIIK